MAWTRFVFIEEIRPHSQDWSIQVSAASESLGGRGGAERPEEPVLRVPGTGVSGPGPLPRSRVHGLLPL